MILKSHPKRILAILAIVTLAGMVGFDLSMTHTERSYISITELDASQEGAALVALATSEQLASPVAMDSPDLTYSQVKELVYMALDRDSSPGALRNIVSPDEWVGIKVNMVTAPLIVNDRKIGGFWNGKVDGIPHWGSTSDLRVTKALIEYLIDNVGPRRISIMEGSGEIARAGSPYFDSYAIDGWMVEWEAFDNLSYNGMVEDFNATQDISVVDIVDLNDEDPILTEVPGGGLQLLGGQKRGWGYEDFKPGYGTPRGKWHVPQALLEVDKLIDQATLKTTAPGITVFMKNYVGTVGMRGFGGGPGKMSVIDNVAIMSGYMDMVRIRPPDYNVASGFWASDGWYGNTVDINHNIVIAGQSVVAAESVAARVMGFNPRDLQQILLARDVGLGSFDERDYQVVGGNPDELSHRFPGHSIFKPSGIQEFLMVGPFDSREMDDDHLGNETAVRPMPGTEMGGKTWFTYAHRPGYPEPYTDFSHIDLGDLNRKTMYAFTYVESPEPQTGQLKFGSDGPARVYVNGELVLETLAGSGYIVRPDRIQLEKGMNTVLVKAVGTARGNGFAVTITDGDRTLPNIRPALDPVATAVVEDLRTAAIPQSAVLAEAYPNPFNATVTLPFSLPRDGHVRMTVWNTAGQRVRVLVDEIAGAGFHQVQWDGRDEAGRAAASGLYLVRMVTGAKVQMAKVTLLK